MVAHPSQELSPPANPVRFIPPAEAEERYYAMLDQPAMAA
jgi:hypothetical protein